MTIEIDFKKNGNTPLKTDNYGKALLTQKGVLSLSATYASPLTKTEFKNVLKKVVRPIKKQSENE